MASILPFTRYINDRNDIGMDEWMRNHLTDADYSAYKNQENYFRLPMPIVDNQQFDFLDSKL